LKRYTFFALGSPCSVKFTGGREDLFDSIRLECIRIEKKYSLIETLNQHGKLIDPELAKLVRLGVELSRLTKGRYDITCHPLVDLWGFYNHNFHLPNQTELEKTLERVDYRRITISGDTIQLDNVEIDLGSMIQGYAADRIIALLKRNHIAQALVDIGGEISGYGRKWRVGIKDPRKNRILKILDVDGSIATSGDYENFFILDGIRYHHIIDCITGYPVQGIIATSVRAKTCILADILATALFILGPEEGKRVAIRYGVEALWVDQDLNIITTEGFYD